MDTSKRIKQNQYHPRPVKRVGPGLFEAECRSGNHDKHTVKRNHDQFTCDCPAQSLCCHCQDVMVDSASKRNVTISFWTTEPDAERQHRSKVEYQANGKAFWVTFKKNRKLVMVRKGWGNVGWEMRYQLDNGKSQVEHVESVDLDKLQSQGFTSPNGGLDWYAG